MSRYCGTCKHFQPAAADGIEPASCARIPDVNDLPTLGPRPISGEAATWDYEGYSSGLYVTATFGCVLHEAQP